MILPQLGVDLYLAFFNYKQNVRIEGENVRIEGENVRIEEKTRGLKKGDASEADESTAIRHGVFYNAR